MGKQRYVKVSVSIISKVSENVSPAGVTAPMEISAWLKTEGRERHNDVMVNWKSAFCKKKKKSNTGMILQVLKAHHA